MTRLECSNLARLYARMSTVVVSTTDLNTYIARAEQQTALELVHLNQSVAMVRGDLTWPANAASVTLSYANFPAVGNTRSVFKVVLVATKDTTDDTMWWVLNAAQVQELAGDTMPMNLGRQTATAQRWVFDGDALTIYPAPTQTLKLYVWFVRVPVPAAADGTAILADFSTAAKEFSELVALRAARALVIDRGVDPTAISARVDEYRNLVFGAFPSFQLQETMTALNNRYRTENPV